MSNVYWHHGIIYIIYSECARWNFLQVKLHTKKFGGDKSKHWQLHYVFLCFYFCSFTIQHSTASGLIFWKVKHIQWLCCPKPSADIPRHSMHPVHYHYFCWIGFFLILHLTLLLFVSPLMLAFCKFVWSLGFFTCSSLWLGHPPPRQSHRLFA